VVCTPLPFFSQTLTCRYKSDRLQSLQIAFLKPDHATSTRTDRATPQHRRENRDRPLGKGPGRRRETAVNRDRTAEQPSIALAASCAANLLDSKAVTARFAMRAATGAPALNLLPGSDTQRRERSESSEAASRPTGEARTARRRFAARSCAFASSPGAAPHGPLIVTGTSTHLAVAVPKSRAISDQEQFAVGGTVAKRRATLTSAGPSEARTQGVPRGNATQATEDTASRSRAERVSTHGDSFSCRSRSRSTCAVRRRQRRVTLSGVATELKGWACLSATETNRERKALVR